METTVSVYGGGCFSCLHNPQFWPVGTRQTTHSLGQNCQGAIQESGHGLVARFLNRTRKGFAPRTHR